MASRSPCLYTRLEIDNFYSVPVPPSLSFSLSLLLFSLCSSAEPTHQRCQQKDVNSPSSRQPLESQAPRPSRFIAISLKKTISSFSLWILLCPQSPDHPISPDVIRSPEAYEETVKKVVATMTAGIDVSSLFTEMTMVCGPLFLFMSSGWVLTWIRLIFISFSL